MKESQLWSLDDLNDGLCTGEQVGTPRVPGSPGDEAELLAEVRAMGGDPDSMFDVGMAHFRKNPEQFMVDFPSVYNKLVDMQNAQRLRDAENMSGHWTPERVRHLDSHRLRAVVLLAIEKFIPPERIAAFRAEVGLMGEQS